MYRVYLNRTYFKNNMVRNRMYLFEIKSQSLDLLVTHSHTRFLTYVSKIWYLYLFVIKSQSLALDLLVSNHQHCITGATKATFRVMNNLSEKLVSSGNSLSTHSLKMYGFFCSCVCLLLRSYVQGTHSIAFSNSLCFPCFVTVQRQILPVPIYVICDYYIHKTDWADLSSLKKNLEISAANSVISFTFRIREFTT